MLGFVCGGKTWVWKKKKLTIRAVEMEYLRGEDAWSKTVTMGEKEIFVQSEERCG